MLGGNGGATALPRPAFPAATAAEGSAAGAAPPRELSAAPTVRRCDLCPDGETLSWDAIAARYREDYLLVIKGAADDDTAEKRSRPPISLAALAGHYEQSWAVRTGVDATWRCFQGYGDGNSLRPAAFLRATPDETAESTAAITAEGTSWFGNFILEYTDGAVCDVLEELGAVLPPLSDADRVENNEKVFFFLGQNTRADAKTVRGTPGHVDKVDHIGTWHVQVSGSKTWVIHPHQRAAPSWPGADGPPVVATKDGEIRVDVEAGDMLIFNSRLWFHETWCPPTGGAAGGLSLSFAREFCFCVAALAAVQLPPSATAQRRLQPASALTEDRSAGVFFRITVEPEVDLPKWAVVRSLKECQELRDRLSLSFSGLAETLPRAPAGRAGEIDLLALAGSPVDIGSGVNAWLRGALAGPAGRHAMLLEWLQEDGTGERFPNCPT